MEGGVNLPSLGKIQPVRHWRHDLCNSERSNPSTAKLDGQMGIQVPQMPCRQHNLIVFLECLLSARSVHGSLHTLLSLVDIFLRRDQHHLHTVSHVVDSLVLRPNRRLQQRHGDCWVLTRLQVEWSATRRCVYGIIGRKLSQRELLHPGPRIPFNVGPQEILQCPFHHLHLPIRLWVKGSTEPKIRAKQFE